MKKAKLFHQKLGFSLYQSCRQSKKGLQLQPLYMPTKVG
jgi:hypothetical protein